MNLLVILEVIDSVDFVKCEGFIMRRRMTTYHGQDGLQIVSLRVGHDETYGGLDVVIVQQTGRGFIYSDELTTSIPQSKRLPANEAYISANNTERKLEFIQKQQLGKVMRTGVRYGGEYYARVQFDMEKLAEFDHDGTVKYQSEKSAVRSQRRLPTVSDLFADMQAAVHHEGSQFGD